MAEIQWEPKQNRLVIRADGFEEAQFCFALPSRRWLPTKGVFQVPLTRQNAKMILDSGMIRETQELGDVLVTALRNTPETDRQWPERFPFRATPFPDQLKALQKGYPMDAFALFMRPGAGKSFVAVNYFSRAFQEELIDFVVVFCPLTVSTVWAGEDGQVAKYSPIPNWSVTTHPKHLDFHGEGRKLQWLIIGVESMSQGGMSDILLETFKNLNFGLLVDESSRVKNRKAIRTKAIFDLAEMAALRMIATGTPSVKSLEDLYAQFEILDSNIIGIGDFFAYRNRYCKMGGFKNKQIIGYDHVEELLGLIEPYTYRCDKPAGIPPKLWTERVVQLTREQRAVYNKVRAGEFEQISVANILNRIEKLQQVAGGYLKEDPKKVRDEVTGRTRKIDGKIIWTIPDNENPKLKALLEWLEEIGNDEQCVVWCKHLWEIDTVCRVLRERGKIATFSGKTPLDDRKHALWGFETGQAKYFVGNQATGGIGVNELVVAHYAFYYSKTFSFEDQTQSEDRLHRIGQTNNALYCTCRAERTVDTLFENAIRAKLDLDVYIAQKLDEIGAERLKEML